MCVFAIAATTYEHPGSGETDEGFTVIGTFALPPDIIHSTCAKNPQCVGFRVKNDGTHGDLFERAPEGASAPGWFSLPSNRSAPRTAQTPVRKPALEKMLRFFGYVGPYRTTT